MSFSNRPVSNGVVVTDESAGEFVPVSFGFSTTGSYDADSTFWVMQAPGDSSPGNNAGVTGGIAAPNETEEYPWILVSDVTQQNQAIYLF